MAISLTSAGLYLEPRYYWGGESGNNYGTPRILSSNKCSLSGSWSGFRVITKSTTSWVTAAVVDIYYNVSTISEGYTDSLSWGGNSLQNSLTLNQKEVA